jgi:SNF2 family DNA or RNA helicase
MPDLALLWEMGTGKTGGIINILRDKYATAGRVRRTLIVSPLVTLFNWKNEFKLHSHIDEEDIVVMYHRSSKGKAKIFTDACLDKITGCMDKNKIVITNYETLSNDALFKFILEWGPEVIVGDEIHQIKNPRAKRTKALIKLGDYQSVEHRFPMSGTLILNSIKDVWAPYRFMDKGETLGSNYYVFENTYMEDENAAWSSKPGHFKSLVPRADKYDALHERIYRKATRVLKQDVLKDLPPLVKVTRHVELGKEQRKYYEEMKRDFVTFVQEKQKRQELSGAVVAQLAVTKALRLQQICSGYVSTESGEEIAIEKNPRLDVTKELLEEIVVEGKHKCIVWCCFRNNYVQLGKLCESLELEHVYITGDMSLKEKQDAMDSFNTDPTCRVIIANRRAGGIGVNLVAANYSIVFSRNFSLGDELQSEARNHRGGSQIHDRITKIDLCARDTIDEAVLDALTMKQDVSKRVIDFVKENA